MCLAELSATAPQKHRRKDYGYILINATHTIARYWIYKTTIIPVCTKTMLFAQNNACASAHTHRQPLCYMLTTIFFDVPSTLTGTASLMKKAMGALQNTKYDRNYISGNAMFTFSRNEVIR